MPSFRIPPRSATSCRTRRGRLLASPGYAGTQPQPPITSRTNGCRRFWTSPSTCSTTGTSRPAPSPSPTGSTSCSACPGRFPRTSRAGSSASTRTTTTRPWRRFRRASSAAAVQLRVPPSPRGRVLGHGDDQGVLLTDRGGGDEHDRRHTGRHRERAAQAGAARPPNCAGSSSGCPAPPCRSTRAASTSTPTTTRSRSSSARGGDAAQHVADDFPTSRRPAIIAWRRDGGT